MTTKLAIFLGWCMGIMTYEILDNIIKAILDKEQQ